MLLTSAQVRAWEEYASLTRSLGDTLVPLQEALRVSRDSAGRLDDAIETFHRAAAATSARYGWAWLDRLAHYQQRAGRPFIDTVREARAMQLQRLEARQAEGGSVIVVIVPGHPSALCDACAAVRGQRLDLAALLEQRPLPVRGCRCFASDGPGRCTCWYSLQREPLPTRGLTFQELVLLFERLTGITAQRATEDSPPSPPSPVQGTAVSQP